MSAPYHDVPNNPLGTDVLLAQIEKLIQERALWRLTAMSEERDKEEAEKQADEIRQSRAKDEAHVMLTGEGEFRGAPVDCIIWLTKRFDAKREECEAAQRRIAELEAEVARLRANAGHNVEAWDDALAFTPLVEKPTLNAELLDALVRLANVHGELSFDRWRDGGRSSFVSIERRTNDHECVNIDHDGTPSSIARAIIDGTNELLGEDTDTDTPTTEARER